MFKKALNSKKLKSTRKIGKSLKKSARLETIDEKSADGMSDESS